MSTNRRYISELGRPRGRLLRQGEPRISNGAPGFLTGHLPTDRPLGCLSGFRSTDVGPSTIGPALR
jgi:hypothetical protein